MLRPEAVPFALDAAHTVHMLFFSSDNDRCLLFVYNASGGDQSQLEQSTYLTAKKSMVFISKLITASSMILLSEIWIGILFVVSGKAIGMTGDIPLYKIIIWCVFGTMGGTVMASAQLLISLFIKSFALPVGIALAGGLSGLLFLVKDLGHIWPYSLMAYGMNSNAPQELIQSGYAQFVIICIAYIVLFTAVSAAVISKRDI